MHERVKFNNGNTFKIMVENKPDSANSVSADIEFELCNYRPKIVETYRNQKNFYESDSLHDLDCRLIHGELYKNCDDPYIKISEIFSEVLNYHAPLKQKSVRGNHDHFMIK